ncbi:hypothetical protein COCOBI_03-4610 [Coccomyxa sp. Obi]|nr:hypothetical protein COCOBI_03-4610 [Coccomyxa sp. Obi]
MQGCSRAAAGRRARCRGTKPSHTAAALPASQADRSGWYRNTALTASSRYQMGRNSGPNGTPICRRPHQRSRSYAAGAPHQHCCLTDCTDLYQRDRRQPKLQQEALPVVPLPDALR